MWLLIAIVLNLQTNPVQIDHGEVIEILSSEKECVSKQRQKIKEYNPLPPSLNLGCVPLNSVRNS